MASGGWRGLRWADALGIQWHAMDWVTNVWASTDKRHVGQLRPRERERHRVETEEAYGAATRAGEVTSTLSPTWVPTRKGGSVALLMLRSTRHRESELERQGRWTGSTQGHKGAAQGLTRRLTRALRDGFSTGARFSTEKDADGAAWSCRARATVQA
jgi:hypothetical protein